MADKPSEATGSEKREAVRIKVDAIAVDLIVNLAGHLSLSSGVLLNLSATGALVEVTQGWPSGTAITCEFKLPKAEKFSLDGEVVRKIHTTSPSQTTRLGIRFRMRAGTDSQLMRWIFAEIARRKTGRRMT